MDAVLDAVKLWCSSSDSATSTINEIGMLVLHAAVNQHGEDEIFRNMAKLAYYCMPQVDFAGREAGKEERQDGHNEPRGLAGGHEVRRKEKHRQQPDEYRCPIFDDEFFHGLF